MKLTPRKQEPGDERNWVLDDIVELIKHKILFAT